MIHPIGRGRDGYTTRYAAHSLAWTDPSWSDVLHGCSNCEGLSEVSRHRRSGSYDDRTPRVIEDGMRGRNGQRKPGTTRGSPRRSRTAKALRISRQAVKSQCARGWSGWGRLSDDGARQHNLHPSEDPWGGGLPHLQGGARSNGRPDTAREYRNVTKCAKGGHKLTISQCMPGMEWSSRSPRRCRAGRCPPLMRAWSQMVAGLLNFAGNVGGAQSADLGVV